MKLFLHWFTELIFVTFPDGGCTEFLSGITVKVDSYFGITLGHFNI